MKSTNIVEVVPVKLENHPNADALSLVRINGYTVCVQTSSWEGVEQAAYVPPDSLVDVNRAEFSWLKDEKHPTEYLVRAKKLRGIVSFGMLVKAPEGSKIGDDVTEALGVKHYEPMQESDGYQYFDSGPNVYTQKYDLDTARKYKDLFIPGEPVLISEKIDGCSARYVFVDRMYVGTRTRWVKGDPRCPYEEALINNYQIHDFCEVNPGYIVHGEIYGRIGKFKYRSANKASFAGFDIMKDSIWLDVEDRLRIFEEFCIPSAPIIAKNFPFDFDKICEIAEGPSALGEKIMEGVVIEPMKVRYCDDIGRLKLKLVSANYLLKI